MTYNMISVLLLIPIIATLVAIALDFLCIEAPGREEVKRPRPRGYLTLSLLALLVLPLGARGQEVTIVKADKPIEFGWQQDLAANGYQYVLYSTDTASNTTTTNLFTDIVVDRTVTNSVGTVTADLRAVHNGFPRGTYSVILKALDPEVALESEPSNEVLLDARGRPATPRDFRIIGSSTIISIRMTDR